LLFIDFLLSGTFQFLLFHSSHGSLQLIDRFVLDLEFLLKRTTFVVQLLAEGVLLSLGHFDLPKQLCLLLLVVVFNLADL
jgi:hypothetical protein